MARGLGELFSFIRHFNHFVQLEEGFRNATKSIAAPIKNGTPPKRRTILSNSMKSRVQPPLNSIIRAPKIPKRIRIGRGQSGICLLAPERLSDSIYAIVAVEQIIGVEGYDLTSGSDEVNAGAFYSTYTEILGIKKFDHCKAEQMLVTDAIRHLNVWQTAKQCFQTFGRVALSCRQREKLKYLAMKIGVLFKGNCIRQS